MKLNYFCDHILFPNSPILNLFINIRIRSAPCVFIHSQNASHDTTISLQSARARMKQIILKTQKFVELSDFLNMRGSGTSVLYPGWLYVYPNIHIYKKNTRLFETSVVMTLILIALHFTNL